MEFPEEAATNRAAPKDIDQYDFKNYTYPLNLSDPKYGGHRVVFFINVQGGGKIVKEKTRETLPLKPNGLNRRLSGEKLIRGVGDKLGLSVVSSNKRLKTAIQLYIPETLGKSYSVSWGEEDMGGMLESLATGILKGSDEFSSGAKGGALETLKSLAGATGTGIGAAAEGVGSRAFNGMRYAQKATGITPGNSKAQLLFNQVDFGSFQFDYRFAPTNEAEAEAVMNIIRTFRHHMLPEFLTENQFLYVYPSEFDIAYYFKDKENEYLEKHITAVLTSMNISYNPNGQFTTFENGMPTHINVNLMFRELGVPTKEISPSDAPGA